MSKQITRALIRERDSVTALLLSESLIYGEIESERAAMAAEVGSGGKEGGGPLLAREHGSDVFLNQRLHRISGKRRAYRLPTRFARN